MPRIPTVRAARVAVASSFGFLVVAWIAMPWVGGDTPFVLDGSNALLTCLSQHDFNACGYTGKLNHWGLMTPIGYWPLLQHIPDVISIELGATSHPARTRVLTLLSVAGVVGSVALAWLVLSRVRQAGVVLGIRVCRAQQPAHRIRENDRRRSARDRPARRPRRRDSSAGTPPGWSRSRRSGRA